LSELAIWVDRYLHDHFRKSSANERSWIPNSIYSKNKENFFPENQWDLMEQQKAVRNDTLVSKSFDKRA